MKLRRLWLVLILMGAIGVWKAAAANGGGVSFSLDCGGFSSSGEILLDRDNTGTGREAFSVTAVDGLGNVIFSGEPDTFFVGGTVSWADGGTFGWTRAPQYNPLSLRVVSLQGNSLAAQVAHVSVGSCAQLPTITATNEGLVATSGDVTIVLSPLLRDGLTSAAVPLNTAPPRPVNPEGALQVLPGYVIVNTDNLSVRSGDGREFTLVAIVDGGTQLVVLGRNKIGEDTETWWYAQVGNIVGWVSGEFLVFRGDLTAVPVVPVLGDLVQPRFFLIRETTPLYSTPNFLAPGLCTLVGGLEYLVVGRDEDIIWYEVQANCNGATVTGWVPSYLGAIRNPAELFIPVTT